jgi:acetyl/propionyl-CoA carboxylase alpha subunit
MNEAKQLLSFPRDKHSLYVEEADEAVYLGPINQPEGNPHQNGKRIVAIALQVGADAIHPGYGYLSENADFAKHVLESGIKLIGPSPYAISVLGDKRQAKEFLLSHAPEVPLIPGHSDSAQDLKSLSREAERIGYPIMIKASAGGGGRGMRIVRDKTSLLDELSRAQSEAKRTFGSADCILEKYISRGKHVEVQLMGDSFGNVFTLLDRECSVQRRHQKVIEEAPCPWMDEELRQAMYKTAITIGKLLKYEGAGTVEFMVDIEERKYYFLEVNTRIQVEHCISEEITGFDIVALQILVAAGGSLKDVPNLQGVVANGHSIECRLCAESPEQDFLPALGTVQRWTPATNILAAHHLTNVRFESSIRTGTVISSYFDSMVVKVIVWAPSRAAAVEKMSLVLRNTVCIGVQTNHLFLQACLAHPGFRTAIDYTTSFIPDNMEVLLRNPYVENLEKTRKLLGLVSALFFRSISKKQGKDAATSQTFASLRGFRNQISDSSNVPVDIIQERSSGSNIVVKWPYTRGNTDSSIVQAILQPLPPIDTSTPFDPTISHVSIAKIYSATVSQTLAKLSNTRSKPYTITILKSIVQIHKLPADITSSQQVSEWLVSDLTIDVQPSPGKLTLHLATDTSSSVFVHANSIGTALAFNYFTPLTFGLSLSAAFSNDNAAGATSQRIHKAPMPCKVLDVLKKNADTVEVGDVLCIIESMKMEIKVLAEVQGTFRMVAKEGESVAEGAILCAVD